MSGFWKKQRKSAPEAKKIETVEKVESKKKEGSKEELKKIIRIILADSTGFSLPYLKPELCKNAPNLLEERDELKRLLSDTRFKVFSHVATAYKEKIRDINLKLDHLKKIAHLITSGYPLTTGYRYRCTGFVRDPGRVMKAPRCSYSHHPETQDAERVHYHSVYFRPIPLWVLENYQVAKPLFDVCFVFSKKNEDFLSIVDQDMGGGRWKNVKESDRFRKGVEEKIRKMSYEDREVSIVGFLPLRPEEHLNYRFSLYVDSYKIEISNELAFQITSWNPKKEMEKNNKQFFIA